MDNSLLTLHPMLVCNAFVLLFFNEFTESYRKDAVFANMFNSGAFFSFFGHVLYACTISDVRRQLSPPERSRGDPQDRFLSLNRAGCLLFGFLFRIGLLVAHVSPGFALRSGRSVAGTTGAA